MLEVTDTKGLKLKILIKWLGEEVELTLFNDPYVLSGILNKKKADEFAELLQMNRSDYLKDIKQFFNEPDQSLKFQLDSNNLILTKSLDEGLDVVYAKIPCRQLTVGEIGRKLFSDRFEESYEVLKKQLEDSKRMEQRLSEEVARLNDRVEECIKSKLEMENDMLNKFLLILNEKKEYISYLKNRLAEGGIPHVNGCDAKEEIDEWPWEDKPGTSGVSNHESDGETSPLSDCDSD